MKIFWAFLAAVGPAAAQAPAPAPAPEPSAAKSPERPALKLQLDEPARGAPRITFGPPEGKLPELGGKPSAALERPVRGDAEGAPYPKDQTRGR